ENDTPPRITKTIATTAAKIGRSMKKCEIRIAQASVGLGWVSGVGLAGSFGCGLWGTLLFCRHLLAGVSAHEAVDNDAVVGADAVLDHAQAVVDLAERHVFLPHDT